MSTKKEMKQRKSFWMVAVFLLALCVSGNLLEASYVDPQTYPIEIFTSNGGYASSPDIDMYVVVSEGISGVDFTFYNESLIDSSVAAVYFDDGSLLGIAGVTNGPGTLFSQPANPGDLPGGNLLVPPFATTEEFSISGDPPPSQNGVNPVGSGEPLEWVRISFDLVGGGTVSDVLSELYSGQLRIGVHVTSLPDGSSESGIVTPEPTGLLLLSLGTWCMLRRRRSAGRPRP